MDTYRLSALPEPFCAGRRAGRNSGRNILSVSRTRQTGRRTWPNFGSRDKPLRDCIVKLNRLMRPWDVHFSIVKAWLWSPCSTLSFPADIDECYCHRAVHCHYKMTQKYKTCSRLLYTSQLGYSFSSPSALHFDTLHSSITVQARCLSHPA